MAVRRKTSVIVSDTAIPEMYVLWKELTVVSSYFDRNMEEFANNIEIEHCVYKPTRCTQFLWLDFIFY